MARLHFCHQQFFSGNGSLLMALADLPKLPDGVRTQTNVENNASDPERRSRVRCSTSSLQCFGDRAQSLTIHGYLRCSAR